MTGYKTWIGGLTLILGGASNVLSGIDWETFTIGDATLFNSGIFMVGNGFAALGIGHKVEKAGKEI